MTSNLSGNQQTDRLQSCVESYHQLVKNGVSYDMRLFDGFEIADCSLKFPVEACRHLTGIHKFGLGNIGKKAEDFFAIALSGGVTFEDACRSNFLINDDIPPEGTGMQTPQAWKKEKEKEAWYIGALTKSQFVERLSALENIHDTICKAISELQKSSPNIELKIYKWNRNSDPKNRPHSSAITADFLLEFEDKSKTEKPFTAFFIRQTENGSYVGESIFTPDYTLSRDLPTEGRRSVPEIKLLSFLEKGSYPNPVNFSLPEAEIREYEKRDELYKKRQEEIKLQREVEEKTEIPAQKYFYELGSLRTKYIKSVLNDADEKKKERFKSNYENHLKRLSGSNYSTEVIEIIKSKIEFLHEAMIEHICEDNPSKLNQLKNNMKKLKQKMPSEYYNEDFIDKAVEILEQEIKEIDKIIEDRNNKDKGYGSDSHEKTAEIPEKKGLSAFFERIQQSFEKAVSGIVQSIQNAFRESKSKRQDYEEMLKNTLGSLFGADSYFSEEFNGSANLIFGSCGAVMAITQWTEESHTVLEDVRMLPETEKKSPKERSVSLEQNISQETEKKEESETKRSRNTYDLDR